MQFCIEPRGWAEAILPCIGAYRVTFIPNCVVNQDAGRWCPHKGSDIRIKEALFSLLSIVET